MFRHLAILSLAASTLLPREGLAWQELSQAELRAKVQNGNSLSLAKILRQLKRAVPGEAVDVRAIEGNRVFYRIIVQRANGKLTPVIVDAATGKVIPNSSAVAHEVGKAVHNAQRLGDAQNPSMGKSSRGKSGGVTANGNSSGEKNGSGGGNDNGNGNGGNGSGNGGNGSGNGNGGNGSGNGGNGGNGSGNGNGGNGNGGNGGNGSGNGNGGGGGKGGGGGNGQN